MNSSLPQLDEMIAFAGPQPCSYLPQRVAVLPLRYQQRQVTPEEFDQCLAAGDRRTGRFLYRTACPVCRCCEPIRLNMESFKPNQTQRREFRRGEAILEARVSRPRINDERVALFNLHRRVRGLEEEDAKINVEGYHEFLADTCCQSIEISYYHQGRLVAVAIADLGRESLSAVYCYYDPHFRGVSLGTYSVLKLAQLARRTGRRYLYLGFYIAESPHMSYKARFHPHERLIGGQWREYK